MEDDMSSQKPHPHLTTKGLLLVSCWLGDNCWVWKKRWHLWGPWDMNINFKNPWQKSAVMKQTQKMRWEKRTLKATSFSVIYSKLWLSGTSQFSLCFCFFSSQLFSPLSPSQCMTWLVAAGARLNCAISYVFTLLASFWAYFLPNISPHIILHFLYNKMLSLISLCKPFLGLRIRIQ